MGALLDIEDLRTYFETPRGVVKAVDGVDIALKQGDTLGIVGESGCGKTVLALSILRLILIPPGKIVSGRIFFNGVDLLQLGEEEMRRVRGKDITMVLLSSRRYRVTTLAFRIIFLSSLDGWPM